MKEAIHRVARSFLMEIRCYANVKRLMDYPFYFGNTLAQDFLRLADNEWDLPHSNDDPALTRDYSILSVGSGDLRNLVFTIASLPDAFKGTLYVTLCDFDPFVMARNVLFLYIMAADGNSHNIDKYLTTIWYSLQYTSKEDKVVTRALERLCSCTTGSFLHELTNGLVKMEDKEVQILNQVWEGWRDKWYIRYDRTENQPLPKFWHGMDRLKCKDKSKSPLYRQRLQAVRNLRLRDDHPHLHKYSGDMWVQNGKFTTDELKPADLTHDNVTLTGRSGQDFSPRYQGDDKVYPYMSPLIDTHDIEHPDRCNKLLLLSGRQPKDTAFVYCVQGDMNPYRVWDYVEARANGYSDHMEDMYFNYIRKNINKTIKLIQEQRLVVKATITEARQLKMEDETFDRIFTSNLQDYFGTHPLVRKFGPLLNRSNKHAVLVMETLHWVEAVYIFNGGRFKGELKCDFGMLYKLDDTIYNKEYYHTLMNSYEMDGSPPHRPSYEDYDYDVGDVFKYLKSLYMASVKTDSKKVPSTKTFMECDGLRMRDVRVGCNKVAPFRDVYRGRQGGIPGTERRTFEWFFPE